MSLSGLKRRRDSYRKDISEESSKLEDYRAKAKALASLYERMKEKKSEMKSLEKSLDSFVGQSYEFWEGNVYKTRYKNTAKNELVENGYGKMITIIDNNLDEINTKRAYYENLVYETEGIIGKLHSCLNSVITEIENWVN
ncbi:MULTISPECIES: DUF5082 domain-containing protein [Clostridium]|uniref:DUF5082 domain-containing protein n=1 Tax=Clostridium cibarium TaxID=2762247 RepID=A0ABR8PYM0_9CLOT|nr:MULTISPECIES: DUF5082 domain-containing protein [Clostridium]MBD7913264.1 DUF5082 domain-containing protein [Clostridium cibarium]